MRFVDGEDLRDLIAAGGPLDPERAVRVVSQVASALDAAHALGLVHRDVKPANVLLASGDHAYLTDFGLTKRLTADADATETGHLVGTLNYVAPEQIRAAGIDPRTDVYALGCVLFHSLTGRAPFADLDREAKLWAHLSEAPPSVGPAVPAAFDEVISRAMAKRPEDRFESAGALARAAAAAAEGEEERSLPVVVGPRPPPSPGDRRRTLVARALITPFNLALLLGTLTAGALFGPLALAVPLALLVYAAAVTVTCLDQDFQEKVLPRERAPEIEGPPIVADGEPPSPQIAALLEQARDKQARINDAIGRAELPYTEVAEEVDRLMATIRQQAEKAELLHAGLSDAPPNEIAVRLDELEAQGDPKQADLLDALRAQLAVQRRLEQQLARFHDRMEGILVEFDTIRGQLIRVSGSTDANNQRRLANRVHDLRDEAGSVAEGMTSAYSEDLPMPDPERT
jgi:Protein kinase domain